MGKNMKYFFILVSIVMLILWIGFVGTVLQHITKPQIQCNQMYSDEDDIDECLWILENP
jgi:hypothetical protein